MTGEQNRKGIRKRILIIAILVAVVLGGFAAYTYRGAIRIRMMDFLISFDDAPQIQNTVGWADNNPPGCWGEARDLGQEEALTAEQQEAVDNLESLVYLSGYQEAPYQHDVVSHDTLRAYPGYNILISGHAPGITMIDMEGDFVHEWFNPEITLYGSWPEAQDRNISLDYWRRAHLFENGDLVVLIDGGGIIKVDKDSNLLWKSEYIGAHHDVYVSDQTGLIYALARNIHVNPDYNTEDLIVEDYISVLDSLGNEIETISILDALRNSQYAPVLRRMPPDGDIIHANTIELIEEGSLPEGYSGPLRENSLLLSFLAVDLICALDLQDKTIYWAESDIFHHQHQPALLENGDILVFDNQGFGENSTALEFSPLTGQTIWYYRGTADNPFYTRGAGACHRLPNGNTLIIESIVGRCFEVTPEKDIVWEYYNPFRAGENQELIATLFDVERIPEDFPVEWLNP